MRTFNFRYTTPIVVCRTITQAQKDQSAERRRYKPNGTRKGAK